MTDIAVFGFDKNIAKHLGVEEAIFHEWIMQNCLINRETKRKFYFKENKWWFPVTEEVLKAFFPFWSKDQVGRLVERLKNNNYLEVNKGMMTTKIPDPKKIRKSKVDTSESKPYTYHVVEDGKTIEISQPAALVVNHLIDQFKHVNPNYKTFFKVTVYRKCMLRMIENYNGDIDTLLKVLSMLPHSNQQKYAPTITTPLEFERLLPKLMAWGKKEQGNQSNNMLL